MPDKLNLLDLARLVPFDFKRQDRQQQIDVALDVVYATRSPRPQLRDDLVDHFQTAAMQCRGETQIELGPVDEDHCIRRSFNRG